ncbi:MAG: ABC transporter permease [Gemmatimonadales bacterium]
MDTLLQDLRYAARSLLRTPTLTGAAIICLALGIGANATTFGVVDRLFFQTPPHVQEPDRVVRVYVRRISSSFGPYVAGVGSYVRYADLRNAVSGFDGVAAYHSVTTSLGRGAEAERIRGMIVTASFFPLLGVKPALGRFFVPDEDRVGAAQRLVVLGYEFWRRRFGGSAAVLGTTLQLGRNPYTVIGVAPARFNGIGLEPADVWLPMSAADPDLGGWDLLRCTNCFWLDVVARLRPGVSPTQVESEATVVFRRPHAERPRGDSAAVVLLGPVQAARGPNASASSKLALWLGAVTGIVLLIASANVANLLLARALQRRREIAVRLAIGAGRRRLVRQLLTESIVLAGLGAAAAVLVIVWLGPVLRDYLLPEHVVGSMLEPRTLAFMVAVALLTGLAAGLAPALHAITPDLTVALKAGERDGTLGRSLTRSALLVAQVALTLVLLVGAGLFIASLQSVRSLRLGLDPDRVLTASVNLRQLGYERPAIDALYEQMRERVLGLPGVTDASLAIGDPFGWSFAGDLRVPGRDSLPTLGTGGPYVSAVTPDYFTTLGTAIRRGRAFIDADVTGAQPVAVVNETMARLVWPGEDPIGQCMIVGERRLREAGATTPAPCTTVVGVVEDTRRNAVIEDATMQYFIPLAQAQQILWAPVTALLIRTAGPADQMAEPVRRTVQEVAPNLPYANVRSLAARLEPELRPWRLGSILCSLFGGLALTLAGVGLYGVLAYTVNRRTHELGVRIALGAPRNHVLLLVVGQGVRVAFVGVAVGAVAALLAGRAVASLLYGVSPHEPAVLGIAALVLLTVAAIASYLPARRATRVDPIVALRTE